MTLQGEKLLNVLKCGVCKGYLAACMKTPLWCPGKSYRKVGGKLVAYTSTGILWSKFVKDHEDRDKKRASEYFKKHKEHIAEHGLFTAAA
jgi:hypothetical protein